MKKLCKPFLCFLIIFLVLGLQSDNEFYSEHNLSFNSNGSSVASRDHYALKSEYNYLRLTNCPTASADIREKSRENLETIIKSDVYLSDRN